MAGYLPSFVRLVVVCMLCAALSRGETTATCSSDELSVVNTFMNDFINCGTDQTKYLALYNHMTSGFVLTYDGTAVNGRNASLAVLCTPTGNTVSRNYTRTNCWLQCEDSPNHVTVLQLNALLTIVVNGNVVYVHDNGETDFLVYTYSSTTNYLFSAMEISTDTYPVRKALGQCS